MDTDENPEPDAAELARLRRLRDHYDTHDTSADMEHGEWVDPTAGQSDR